MPLYDLFDQRQAETTAAMGAARGAIHLIESLKDASLVRDINADTRVNDLEYGLAVAATQADGDGSPSRRELEDVSDQIPHCDSCGAMMRPGVVWFGELLPPDAITNAQEAACSCDVMIVAGTAAVVQPAASLADWAKASGAFLVEVNPEETPVSDFADVRFPVPSGEILPQVAESLASRSDS